MALVNNNANNGMVFPQLAPLPQQLPTTQSQWQQFLNAMQQWQQAVALQPAFQANQSADVDPSHVSFVPGTIYQQSNTLLGLKLLWVQPTSNTYFKIATLPPTSLGTLDSINIRATLNGTWAANNTTLADIVLGNRNAFSYQWNRVGPAQTNAAIEAYTESDGSLSVYAVGLASSFSYAYLSILNGGDGAAFDVVLYPTPTAITSPTGSLVFNTANEATYPPTGISSMLSGKNTWTNGNTYTSGINLTGQSAVAAPSSAFADFFSGMARFYAVGANPATIADISLVAESSDFSIEFNVLSTTHTAGALTAVKIGDANANAPINMEGPIKGLGPVAGALVDATPDEQSVSVVVTGFSTLSAATIVWSRKGNQATVFIPTILGTSNATSFTVAIPTAIQPARQQFVSVPQGLSEDNTANITDCSLLVNTTSFQFYHNFSATGWTAAGQKSSGGFSFSFLLN